MVTDPLNRPDGVDAEERLSALFASIVDSGRTLGPSIARRPDLAIELARLLRRLPTHRVLLPRQGERHAVLSALRQYRGPRLLTGGVSAVLPIPAAPGTYDQGRERATVRRKNRAARAKGVAVRPVDRDDRPRLLALADEHERTNARAEYRNAEPDNTDLLGADLWLAAFDEAGDPIALAVIPTCGEWATLRYFRTLVPGAASSDARYLLASAVADELARRRVRFLVDPARPHWLPNGLRHFQRMLGFRLVRLSLPRD